jgi:hypothetical protein
MLKGYLEKLSDRQLTFFTVITFVLFMVDCFIPDPLPLLDEGILLYAALMGFRALATRRNVQIPALTKREEA